MCVCVCVCARACVFACEGEREGGGIDLYLQAHE